MYLVALAFRLLLLFLPATAPAPDLEGDERGYAAVAGSLARGEGFGFTIEGTTTTGAPVERRLAAFRAPLLSLVLAPVHGLAGGAPLALRLWNGVLGSLAAPLALLLAARLGGARAGWIAGLAVALWPSHAWLSVRVLSEPLDAVLLLAGADLLLRRRWAPAGVAMGLAILCRPGGLLTVALLVPVAFLVEGRKDGGRCTLAFLLAAGAVTAPWLVRNHGLFGSPTLVTSTGVTLLGGNSDAALEADPPGKWVPPDRAWAGPDAPDLGMYGWSALDEGESDLRFRRGALRWAREHPGRAARLAFFKGVRFLDPDTRSGQEDAGLKALVGWLSWGLLLLVLGAAFAAGIRSPRPEWWAAAALLAGHLGVALLSHGDARMRAPVEPALLALLAAPWLAERWGKWTGGSGPATVEP